MELTGTVIAVLPQISGQGKNAVWRKQEFVIEIPSQYPKRVCISLWGDKIDEAALKINDAVTAHIDIESREYNSRWFTEVKAWKIEKKGGYVSPYSEAAPLMPPTTLGDNNSNDLPF